MYRFIKMLFVVALSFFVISCKKQESKISKDSILTGSTTIIVDETLKPIIEDQIQIFESRYKAKITIDAKSEAEVIQALVKDSAHVAILSRKLTKDEAKIFEAKKLVPKITPFAKDAIALISNKSNKDTLVALQDIINYMQGKKQSKIKGLVFDNPNSSTARYIMELAGITSLPKTGVFSFKTNDEVIKYVAEDDGGIIGVIGMNYIFEPSKGMQQYLDKVNVLSVKGSSGDYYSPSQNNIAEGKYALARDLYIINCQGYSGLGMGFASFIAGETGQRIVLKSGLVPFKVPTRSILVRKKINNDKK